MGRKSTPRIHARDDPSRRVGTQDCKFLPKRKYVSRPTILSLTLSFFLFYSKAHALDGHMLAFFLSQALIDSLEELLAHPNHDSGALLKELKEQEADAYQAFKEAELPKDALKFAGRDDDPDLDLDFKSLLFKGPNFCHTARLPAMSRYLGHLTDTDKVGGIAAYGHEEYDVGTLFKNLKGKTEILPLAFEEDKSRNKGCSVPIS